MIALKLFLQLSKLKEMKKRIPKVRKLLKKFFSGLIFDETFLSLLFSVEKQLTKKDRQVLVNSTLVFYLLNQIFKENAED